MGAIVSIIKPNEQGWTVDTNERFDDKVYNRGDGERNI